MELIAAMLERTPRGKIFLASLPSSLVEEMQDGHMGSLRFRHSGSYHQRFGEKIAEAEFTDADGVPVSVTINLDDRGHLFELDMWKVDFSLLKRYPRAEEVRVR
jgi:hypothetical protein